MEHRILSISEEVDEVQVWYKGKFVGAGAFTKPYVLQEAICHIVYMNVGVLLNKEGEVEDVGIDR